MDEARLNLERALALVNLAGGWREIDINAPDTPAERRGFGSPTILVDGADVGDGVSVQGASCRLYSQDGVIGRAPSIAQIADRLRETAALGRPISRLPRA